MARRIEKVRPPPATFSDEVIEEIHAIARYIARDNLDAGIRFFEVVQDAFAMLAAQPGMGAPKLINDRVIRGLRSWPVTGFKNYLIFYLPRDAGGIEVLHVLHGARDVDAILGREFP